MKLIDIDDVIHIYHFGEDSHAKTHTIRPDAGARLKFRDAILTAPEVRHKNQVVGSATRPSVTELHPAFSNLDRTANIRRNILRHATHQTTLEVLASFEKQMSKGKSIIQSSIIQSVNGHISIQTEFMAARAATLESGMQTDSVHGFVRDIHFDEINVTFTSAYCPTIQRTIPLLLSILFGKSKYHCKEHFRVLLKSLPIASWTNFLETFPGMSCDFSDAERVGFELAVREHFSIDADEEIALEKHYRFCEVHFKRSLTRVRRNGAIVSSEKEMDFNCLIQTYQTTVFKL